jgi:hypothetical protein
MEFLHFFLHSRNPGVSVSTAEGITSRLSGEEAFIVVAMVGSVVGSSKLLVEHDAGRWSKIIYTGITGN